MSYSPFQFSTPVLIRSTFQAFRESREEDDVQVNLQRRIIRDTEKKPLAYVELTVQLNKKENTIREDACFVAEVTLQSAFKWDESVNDDSANKLLQINAPALLVSYARPILTQLTAASPVPTYNLPFINMDELFKQTQE